MLLALVLRAARPVTNHPTHDQRATLWTQRLLLATALLGLFWNLGALIIYGARDWGVGRTSGWFEAAVFTALGFLPAVVVHSVLRAGVGLARRNGTIGANEEEASEAGGAFVWARMITILAYALSAFAGSLHFYAAPHGETPSATALRTLTIGFSSLTLVLIIVVRRSS